MAGESPEVRRKRTPRSAVLDARPEYEALGRWICERRLAAGLGQRELSRALGKSDQFLNKVEHGRQRIDVVEFLDLCRALADRGDSAAGTISTNLARMVCSFGHSG